MSEKQSKISSFLFTQIPNVFIDKYMKSVSPIASNLFFIICRKTIGWQKDLDIISSSQLMKFSGTSKPSVIKAIKELLEKEVITRDITGTGKGRKSIYGINLEKLIIDEIDQYKKTDKNSEINGKNSLPINGGNGKDILPIGDIIGKNSLPTKEKNIKKKEKESPSPISDKEEEIQKEAYELSNRLFKILREGGRLPMPYTKLAKWKHEQVLIAREMLSTYRKTEIIDIMTWAINHDFWQHNLNSFSSFPAIVGQYKEAHSAA